MWAVTLTYREEPDAETIIDWDEQLDATVAAIPGRGSSVTLYARRRDPVEAARIARDRAGRVIPHRPIGIEVLTEDDYAARARSSNIPDLVSATEAGEMLGVSRQRIHQLHAEHRGFPSPLYELRTGPLWTATAIESFASEWERKPGRPRREAS